MSNIFNLWSKSGVEYRENRVKNTAIYWGYTRNLAIKGSGIRYRSVEYFVRNARWSSIRDICLLTYLKCTINPPIYSNARNYFIGSFRDVPDVSYRVTPGSEILHIAKRALYKYSDNIS